MSAAVSEKARINHKSEEAKHEKKTTALVKAIWAHLGGSVGVTGTGSAVGSTGTNNIICIFWDHPCLSGIIIFAFQLVYLLNTQSHTVVQPHVSAAWFIFRLQPPSVM